MNKVSYDLVKELRNITGIGVLECKNALLNSNGNIKKAILNLRKEGIIKAEKKKINKTSNGIIFSCKNNHFGVILEILCETDFVSKNKNFYNFGKEIVKYSLKNKCKNLIKLKNVFENDRIELLNKVNENIIINRFNFISGDIISCYSHYNKIGVLLSASLIKNKKKDYINYKEILNNIALHIAANKPEYLNFKDIPKDIIDKEKIIQSELSIKLNKPKEYFEKIVSGKINKFFSNVVLMKQKLAMDDRKTVKEFTQENNVLIKKFIRFEIGEYK
ncbi:translation elongation factor Ts [Buchnera aphidicola (Ceratoglyphina bambusae)]|uniref:translation elongation factor Ts n=1 Tax=Buchnera aphidicola TaxID=9 RepID=UPI0031B821DF